MHFSEVLVLRLWSRFVLSLCSVSRNVSSLLPRSTKQNCKNSSLCLEPLGQFASLTTHMLSQGMEMFEG